MPWDKHDCLVPPTATPSLSFSPQRDAAGADAFVVSASPLSDKATKVTLYLVAEDVQVQMLAAAHEVAEGAFGKLARANGSRSLELKTAATQTLLAGPYWACEVLDAWIDKPSDAATALMLARDLGLHRFSELAGYGTSRFLRPDWRAALRLYLPAIEAGDADATLEALRLLLKHAPELITPERRKRLGELIRLIGAANKAELPGLIEEVLELYPL